MTAFNIYFIDGHSLSLGFDTYVGMDGFGTATYLMRARAIEKATIMISSSLAILVTPAIKHGIYYSRFARHQPQY